MRISDWSSDVCSSDLPPELRRTAGSPPQFLFRYSHQQPEYPDTDAAERRSRSRNRGRLADFAWRVPGPKRQFIDENGKASCRERGCPYVVLSVVAGSLKKKEHYE